MRKRYDAAFKAEVVLEALREQGTLAEIGSKYGIHPNQIIQWKKTFLKNLPEVFSKKKDDETETLKKRESELRRQIGQLKYEVDWLKKIWSTSHIAWSYTERRPRRQGDCSACLPHSFLPSGQDGCGFLPRQC